MNGIQRGGTFNGIGFENIRIYNRILFHSDCKVFTTVECYDFAYMVMSGELVEISGGNEGI